MLTGDVGLWAAMQNSSYNGMMSVDVVVVVAAAR